MPTMVVEIHVPLLPTPDLPAGSYPFPWIEEVEDLLSDLEDQCAGCARYRGSGTRPHYG